MRAEGEEVSAVTSRERHLRRLKKPDDAGGREMAAVRLRDEATLAGVTERRPPPT
jgi:hypothetical protein